MSKLKGEVLMDYIPQSEPWLDEQELAQLAECITDNWITEGKKVKKFEERIAELCDVKYAIACTSGTIALYMGLKAMGIGEGDEVIVPDFTFIASANSVVLTGAKPVFVDVDSRTFNIDPDCTEEAITSKTKAIMPVHIYGQSADMDAIMDLARDYNLKVIEDNAQGIGVKWQGKPTGSFGDVSCLAFYADKVITTGEGGIVLTNNPEIAEQCLILKHQGRTGTGIYHHEHIGYNFRLTDLQAAVGLAQLDKLPVIIDKRRKNEALYRKLLDGVVELPYVDPRCFNVPFRVNILVDDPGALSVYLNENNISSREFFYPLHMQPCYNQEGFYPNSVEAHNRGLSLPSSTNLFKEQIEYICEKIKAYYGTG